jgi:hypothetical protein
MRTWPRYPGCFVPNADPAVSAKLCIGSQDDRPAFYSPQALGLGNAVSPRLAPTSLDADDAQCLCCGGVV